MLRLLTFIFSFRLYPLSFRRVPTCPKSKWDSVTVANNTLTTRFCPRSTIFLKKTLIVPQFE